MSVFFRRLFALAAVLIGVGAGLAHADDSPYAPQPTPTPEVTATPAPTPTPTAVPTATPAPTPVPTVTVGRTTPPTPNERAEALSTALTGALDGITRKNLIHGTKIAFTVTGGGTLIVSLQVRPKHKTNWQTFSRLHVAAAGATKTTFKVGKTGKKRLNGAANAKKDFKVRIVVSFYTTIGSATSTKSFTAKG